MEIQGWLRRLVDLPALAWRSLGLVALLIGLSLLCANPTRLAATTTNIFSPAVQNSLDSSTTVDETDADLKGDSDQIKRIKKRLFTVALVGGVLLLLLTFAYGYLRLELITRGFYSGRLQLASGIASLSVVAAAYFLWRWLINV